VLEHLSHSTSHVLHWVFSFFIIILLLYLEYIATFTKVLIIYHSWIQPRLMLLYSPLHHYWNSFNRSQFSIFIHEYIIFPLHSPSYTLSLCPPPSQRCIWCFWDRVSQTVWPGWLEDVISVSWVARIKQVSHRSLGKILILILPL
jgi:hypothetical protein